MNPIAFVEIRDGMHIAVHAIESVIESGRYAEVTTRSGCVHIVDESANEILDRITILYNRGQQ